MFQQKWFDSDKELKEGDLVYFLKKESKLDGKWIVGVIDSLERSRDSLIRMVWVRYQNAKEVQPQLTSRTVRQLVKLWSIEDHHISEDLAELERKFGKSRDFELANAANDEIHGDVEDPPDLATDENTIANDDFAADGGDKYGDGIRVSESSDDDENIVNNIELLQVETEGTEVGGAQPQQQGGDDDSHLQPGGDDAPPAANTRSKKACSMCCCVSHHKFSLHYKGKAFQTMPMALEVTVNRKLVAYYAEQFKCGNQIESGKGLDEMIMGVGTNLRL